MRKIVNSALGFIFRAPSGGAIAWTILMVMVIFFAGKVFGQDKPEPPAPSIPTEVQIDYFAVSAQSLRVQAELSSLILAMERACGDKHYPAPDPKNQKRIACIKKPEVVK